MSFVRALSVVAATALGISVAPASFAATTWTMASGYPESSFLTKNIRLFIEDVEKESGGALKIDLRSNDSLIKHDAIKRAVQSGQVPIGEIRLGVYGNEGAMYILDSLPNIAANYDEAWKLMEAQKPYFNKLFAKNGMRLITYAAWPGQGFYTKFPVKSVEDLKGKKLRIYSTATQKMGEMLGFQATILPFAEVPQAFSTGLIEALFTSAQTGTDIQAWDHVKHFTYTGTMHNKNAVIVNERAFRALDKKTQDVVLAAGERATKRAWTMSKESNDERLTELRKNGMTVSNAPPEVNERLSEIGKAMMEDWRKTATAEEQAVLDAYLKVARK